MELFEIVDEEDRVIGLKPRDVCHGNSEFVHRVAHVLVFNSNGELLLQKRTMTKDIQPGKWDTSMGGHLAVGENYLEAALRELKEELGIEEVRLEKLYRYRLRNEVESENVTTYKTVWDGEINFDRGEIDQVRFWTLDEIRRQLGSGIFTPNFEDEFEYYTQLK